LIDKALEAYFSVLFFHRHVINGGLIMKEHRALKRIFIVDARPVVHEGMRSIINGTDDLIVCGEAFNVSQALEVLETLTLDLVIVDIPLGDDAGIQLIQEIQHLNADLPILVFSVRLESDYAEPLLKVGARGYLMKNESSEIIVSAIRTVLEGDIYLSGTITANLLSSVSGRSDNPSKPTSVVGRLSPREFEVFQLIGKGNSTREIAQHLHLSIKTIEFHSAQIKQKLGLKNATKLAYHAVRWMQRQE
jgi:DNA-binding NarL/FixJ family response regulator